MFKKSFSTLQLYSRRLMSLQKSSGIDWKEQEKILMEPYEYANKLPCKNHRLMAPAFNHWLQIPKEKLHGIQKANETFISWILLLDDIQDNSSHRYGVPATHCVYGEGLTINAANMAMLLMQKQISELGNPLGQKVLFKMLQDFLHGQGIDLYWRDNYICPAEEMHIEIKKKKTGTCFALPVALMQLYSSNEKDYVGLATNFGTYYEILDDYYNLFQPKGLQKLTSIKPDNFVTCSDITDGKITLPIIHASQFPDVADELADILKQRTSDPTLQNRVITLLKKHGSDEYMRGTLRTMEADIRMQINHLGGNSMLSDIMDDLTFQKQEP